MKSRPFLTVLAAGVLATATLGCSTRTSDRDLRPVTASEAVALAAGKPGSAFKAATKGVWVDPRRAETYAEGHIPGAMSIPFGSGDFESQAEERLGGFDPIIVYGDDYQDILANAASKRLIELGFKSVYTLRGGIEQWIADGYEVDAGQGAD